MTPEPDSPMLRRIRRLGLSQRRLSIVSLVLVIAILVLAVVLRNQLPGVEAAGYPAVFLISLVGNATLIFPIGIYSILVSTPNSEEKVTLVLC